MQLPKNEQSRLNSIGVKINAAVQVLHLSRSGCILKTDMCIAGISREIADNITVEYE